MELQDKTFWRAIIDVRTSEKYGVEIAPSQCDHLDNDIEYISIILIGAITPHPGEKSGHGLSF